MTETTLLAAYGLLVMLTIVLQVLGATRQLSMGYLMSSRDETRTTRAHRLRRGHMARRNAGLSVLQIWKHADSSTKASVLLDVNDRKKADNWLARSNALSSDDKGTVTGSTAYFVKSA